MQTEHQCVHQTLVKAELPRVWRALTDPEIVRSYFFGTDLVTDWTVGGPIVFQGSYDGEAYRDRGVVQEYVPEERLSFSYLSNWSGMPDQPENYLLVQYEEKAKHSAENWKGITDALKKVIE